MIRCWEKNHIVKKKYYNYQEYCDCQFISLINACIFWNKPHIKPHSEKYKKLAKKAGCIHGGCIDLREVYKLLNVKFKPGKLNLSWVKKNLPVHFAIFCHKGYHSVLCIKVEGNKLHLANYATNRLHTMEWKKFKMKNNRRINPEQIIVEGN